MSNRIVEIEYELFLSIRNGHRPSNDDCYKNKRKFQSTTTLRSETN
jgi:hypothetical protein